jgi:hypothetical protein
MRGSQEINITVWYIYEDEDMPLMPPKKTGVTHFLYRSHLKIRILVQGQGGAEVQPAGILKYSEELKRGPNTEIGPKDFFEIASN